LRMMAKKSSGAGGSRGRGSARRGKQPGGRSGGGKVAEGPKKGDEQGQSETEALQEHSLSNPTEPTEGEGMVVPPLDITQLEEKVETEDELDKDYDVEPSTSTTAGLNSTARIRRRRRRASVNPAGGSEAPKSDILGSTERISKGPSEEAVNSDGAGGENNPIRELTKRFRLSKEEVLAGIERDPDFMFRKDLIADKEYDMTNAVMGLGKANKQGTYILPYLQTGHIVGLLVVLVATFGYLPGFPLTELPEATRQKLAIGLEINYAVNSLLAAYAFVAARNRGQPVAFWMAKTLVLGGLSLDELRSNIPLIKK